VCGFGAGTGTRRGGLGIAVVSGRERVVEDGEQRVRPGYGWLRQCECAHASRLVRSFPNPVDVPSAPLLPLAIIYVRPCTLNVSKEVTGAHFYMPSLFLSLCNYFGGKGGGAANVFVAVNVKRRLSRLPPPGARHAPREQYPRIGPICCRKSLGR
jgi:hypothetical protein